MMNQEITGMRFAGSEVGAHTINLRPPRPALQAANFDDLVEAYFADQEGRLDLVTIESKRCNLDIFLKWWEIEGPQRQWLLDERALVDFDSHINSLVTRRGKPLGWWSRHDVVKQIRLLFRWAHRGGYIPVDFSKFVLSIKGAPPPRKPIELADLAAMMMACDQTRRPIRNRAIIAVLAGTAVRREECTALWVEDVEMDADNSGYIHLRVTKGDRPRTVAFDQFTGVHLRALIDTLPVSYGPLFISEKCKVQLNDDGFYRMFKEITELAGVRDRIKGPHDLRRLFATTWARYGQGQNNLLQRQMGHVSFSTTSIYILSDVSNIKEALMRSAISPLAQLHCEAEL